MKTTDVNGNLVLTRREKDLVHIVLPDWRIKQLAQKGEGAVMSIRTYEFKQGPEGTEVKLAFMDRERNFDIQRDERFKDDRV
jgi:hypothetical protein